MGRRTIHLHVDFSGLEGDLVTEMLRACRDDLRDQGFAVPVRDAGEPRLAAIEIRRDHRAHGLRRKQVEGAWARICRRSHKGRRTPLASVPGFGGCTPDQVDLLLDSLVGLRVHVVATVPAVTSAEAAESLDHALAHWRSRLESGRLTVVALTPGDWSQAWQEYAAAAGVDSAALPLGRPRVA
jgi:hypothetical protein